MTSLKMSVPCGQCILCRKRRAAQWAARLTHEARYHDRSSFITLTYSSEYLPDPPSVCKRDWQLFLKKLRKIKGGQSIRYFACGEYGDTNFRPHYHAIMFGISREDRQCVEAAWSRGGKPIGIVSVDACEIASIRYVSGYITKKIKSNNDEFYHINGLQPPFQLQSKGLGKRFAEENKRYLTDNTQFHISGLTVGIPRYYRKKVDIPASSYMKNARKRIESAIEIIEEQYGVSSSMKKHFISTERNLDAYLDFLLKEHGITKAQEKALMSLAEKQTKRDLKPKPKRDRSF